MTTISRNPTTTCLDARAHAEHAAALLAGVYKLTPDDLAVDRNIRLAEAHAAVAEALAGTEARILIPDPTTTVVVNPDTDAPDAEALARAVARQHVSDRAERGTITTSDAPGRRS